MNAFLFSFEWIDALLQYPDGQREALYDAICIYAKHGEVAPLSDPGHKALFSMIKTRIDANKESWEERCEKNRTNGKKGGRPRKAAQKENQTVSDENPKKPNGFSEETQKNRSVFEQNPEKPNGFFEKPKKTLLNLNLNLEEEKKKEESLRSSSFCAEVEKPTSSPNVESVHIADTDLLPFEQPVVRLPLVDGTAASFMQAEVDHWQELYPACDVMGELRKMQGWLESNPKNRKTARGIKRFITGWLSRAQDRARPVQQQYKPQQRPSADMAEALLNATGGDPYAFLSNRGYAAGPDGSELSQEHDAGRASAPLQGLGQHAGGY